ncbi:MAG: hypothetical protein JWM36_3236 [Hyphomicrobiales bacterium]|nr:hypothetical protein [Hyphomicrobiales bacterium]
MATVTKREWTYKGEKKSAWIIRYTDRGGVRRQETFEKKKEADARRQKIEAEISGEVHVAQAATITFKEVADLFLRECDRRRLVKDGIGRATVKNYEAFIRKHMCCEIGATKLTQISPQMLRDLVNGFSVRMKRNTVQRAVTVLGLVLDFAISRDLLKRNLMRDHKIRAPAPTGERIAVPSIEEIRRLLSVVSEPRLFKERTKTRLHKRALVALAIFCGLRRGEINALKWENIDFAMGRIHVKLSNSQYDGVKLPKSTAGIRVVPITLPVLDVLLELHKFAGNPSHGFLFMSKYGGLMKPSQFSEGLWKPVAREAGLCDEDGKVKYHLHSLRHAAVSLLIAEGLSPLHVKTMIGHADIATTLNVYGHLFPEDESVKTSAEGVAARFYAAPKQQRIITI